MQKIKLSYEIKHTIAAPLKQVYTFFSDMYNIHVCTADVVGFEVINEQTSKWRLKTRQELGICFTPPEYCMLYNYKPDTTISWRSTDANDTLSFERVQRLLMFSGRRKGFSNQVPILVFV